MLELFGNRLMGPATVSALSYNSFLDNYLDRYLILYVQFNIPIHVAYIFFVTVSSIMSDLDSQSKEGKLQESSSVLARKMAFRTMSL